MLSSLALNVLTVDGVVGDGRHDDSAGLQHAIDSATLVYIPLTEGGYLISQTLKLGDGQRAYEATWPRERTPTRRLVVARKAAAGTRLATPPPRGESPSPPLAEKGRRARAWR